MDNNNNIFRVAAVLYASNNYDISLKQVYRKVIEDALFQLGKEVELGELAEFIEKQYSLLFTTTEIENTLSENKFKENFSLVPNSDGCKYKLSEKRKSLLQSKGPIKTLPDYVEEYVNKEKLNEENGECILRFMYGMYTSNIDSFQKLLQTKHVDNVTSDEKFTAEEASIINGFLDWDDEGKNVAIFNIASYALEYCMITNKRETNLKLSDLRKKVFYLDTNILYRAIGINGEDRKKRTLQFMSKLMDLDSEILVTRQTNEEFEQSINSYIKKLRKAESPAISSKVYTEYVTFDDIWRFYHLMAASRINFTVDLFNAYLKAEYKKLQDTYHITVEDDRLLKDSDEELKNIASQIKGVSDTKTFETALFDAKNIKWIEQQRNGSEKTIFDAKHFMLSSDGGLRYWDSRYHSTNVPIVILPSQWLSIILRYVERTNDDFKSFVCFLNIKSTEVKMTDEQIHAVLSGIAEMTMNVDQQRELLEAIIDEDFKNGAKQMTPDQIRAQAKKTAERKLQKQLAEEKDKNESLQIALGEAETYVKKEKEDKEALVHRHNAELADKEKTVAETQNRETLLKDENATLKSSLTAKENEIAKLQEQIDKSEFKRKKVIGIFWKLVLLSILLSQIIWYLLVEKDADNYMGSVYRFVYSLAPAKMPIITFGISLLYTACLLPLVKSLWKSVFSSWKQKE
jgi:hypothetical protein